MKLFELPGVHLARRAQHQVLVALGLRKCDHVPDVLGVGDRHHQPVDAGRDSTVRRHAVLERVEQVSELGLNPLPAHAEDLEDSFLEPAVVDADAPTRHLEPVGNAVVRTGPHFIRALAQQVHVLGPRRRERMMTVSQVALVILFEQVHGIDPRELPFPVADELSAPRDLPPQQAHHGLRFSATVGDQEHDVVGSRADGCADGGHLTFADVAVQRARNPGQPLRACAFGQQGELVELAAAHVLSARDGQTSHDAARVERGAKNGRA